MKFSKKTFIFFIILAFFSTPFFVKAQINMAALDSSMEISVSPQFPGANQDVSISIDSFFSNLSSARISWVINGETIKSGIGEKRFSFTTGNLGTVSNIEIKVEPQATPSFSNKIQIRPAEIDLIWEGETYTPAFYKGKSLYSRESRVFLQAVPHFINSNGNRLSDENLIYTWSNSQGVLNQLSGYGKNFLTYHGSIFEKRERIEVLVESTDGSFKAKGFAFIENTDPKIVFYENSPLFGILKNHAIPKNYRLSKEEVTLVAEPFFFSTENSNNNLLSFNWTLNNSGTVNHASPNSIVLRREGGRSGQANLSILVSHAEKILQGARNNISISF